MLSLTKLITDIKGIDGGHALVGSATGEEMESELFNVEVTELRMYRISSYYRADLVGRDRTKQK
jgi:hypothetical protein